MYLQITTKCNMHCAHCCYSCTMRGKHMSYETAIDAINFAKDWEEGVSIGGGEPTLHPRFFDILERCMDTFDYVWMATNGSKTKTMLRLSDILNDCDYENAECTCGYPDDCSCMDAGYISNPDGKLTVELSQDRFHDSINQRVVDLWTKRASATGGYGVRHSGFGIRNTSASRKGIVGQGRAKKNGYDGSGCVCSDIIIKPNGDLRLCGCTKAPKIGDVWRGIDENWEAYMRNNERFNDTRCSFGKG